VAGGIVFGHVEGCCFLRHWCSMDMGREGVERYCEGAKAESFVEDRLFHDSLVVSAGI